MAGNGQKVIDLDKQRMTAMAQKDIAKLNELIADDLVYTHSSARLDTKQSLIGNMESGSTVYTSVVPSDVKAQDLGDTVVLTGSCRISVNAGGRPNSFGVRFRRLCKPRRAVADGDLAVDAATRLGPLGWQPTASGSHRSGITSETDCQPAGAVSV